MNETTSEYSSEYLGCKPRKAYEGKTNKYFMYMTQEELTKYLIK